MAAWLKAVRLPVALAMATWLALRIMVAFIPGPAVHAYLEFWTAARLALAFWVGWRVRAHVTQKRDVAALSGVVISLVDHAILQGIMVMIWIVSPTKPEPAGDFGFTLLSIWWTMLRSAPLPIAVAFVGAVLQEQWSKRRGALAVAS